MAWSAWLSLPLIVTFAAPLGAQDKPEPAAAAAMFDAGLADMRAGRLDVGCPKLAESYRLDTRPGVLFTLAECENRWGKIASAAAHYEDYLRIFEALTDGPRAAQRERADVARERLSALRPRVPTLKLVLPDSAPPTTIVLRDGVAIGAPSLGVATPVDPGRHVIAVEVPGGARSEQFVDLAVGEAKRLELTVDLASARTPSRRVAPAPQAASAASEQASARGPIAIAAFSIAAVGLGFGGVMGAMALAKKSNIDAGCTDHLCTPSGKDAADAGQRFGWMSTIGFAVGGVAAVTGIVVLAAGAPAKPRAAVSPTANGVVVRGAF